MDCSWRAQGDQVRVSIGNRSRSRVECTVGALGALSRSTTLRAGGSDTLTVQRDPESTRWYRVNCTSRTGEPEAVDQRDSFVVWRD
ncbi:hypothetical protein nbrc107697_04620 [Gordonia crocea]|uniref:Uncharacterized protein n=2 Tax=Gordonia crocea TaxID=589162 RepID=A0A7M3SUU9_9ACTN|nr:hypothetical protein nbrc107697_04620 [Gordonia crocea]